MKKQNPYICQYTKKIVDRISSPRFVGSLAVENLPSEIRVVQALDGEIADGCVICFYWHVDTTDGVIADISYQLFGPAILVAICEAICELALRKNYLQASHISAELIDRHLRDKPTTSAIFRNAHPYLLLATATIAQAAMQCSDLSINMQELETPIAYSDDEEANPYPGWESLNKEEKLKVIEEVITDEIQPYVEMDGGGIELRDIEKNRVTIVYQGNCSGCFAATGSTLNSIQHILQKRVYPTLEVIPVL